MTKAAYVPSSEELVVQPKRFPVFRLILLISAGLIMAMSSSADPSETVRDQAEKAVESTEPALPASAAPDGALARFLTATQGMAMGERYRSGRAMSKEERKQLVAEYKALSKDERQALKGAIPRSDAEGRVHKVEPDQQGGGIGTVQYDTGVGHTEIPSVSSVDVGNRFNGAFPSPHSISKVTFQANGNFFSSLNQLRVYGPPGTGTTAPVLLDTSVTHTTLGAPVMFTLPTAVTGLTGSFLVGMIQSTTSITSTAANPAVDINDGGNGFHGMTIQAGSVPMLGPATVGMGFNASPTVAPGVPFNAIIRATGNNLPVELMSFTVD